MINRRTAVRLLTLSLVAVASAGRPAPADDPGRDQFTRVRHTGVAAGSSFISHRMFNARSCAECHRQGGIGGGGPNENNVRLVNKRFTDRSPQLANHFGPGPGVAVLHRHSSAPEYAAWRLELIQKLNPLDPEVLRPMIQLGIAQFINPAVDPEPLEQRNTPPLFGLGLIDSIPQLDIDQGAVQQAWEIRGRSPRLPGGGRGRFGWKSNTATLAAFNENACAVELGLSTPRFNPAQFQPALFQPATFRPDAPMPPDKKSGEPARPVIVDMTDADLAALTRFVADLPPPRQVIEPELATRVGYGRYYFHAVGCAECHTPNLANVTGIYSDLLLHTVSTSGGVYYGPTSTPEFDIVTAGEFRTPPLWGVADSAPYLHDGSAPTLDRAILAHNQQALKSRDAYVKKLSFQNRYDLVAFLESLRAPEQQKRDVLSP